MLDRKIRPLWQYGMALVSRAQRAYVRERPGI
jgi:hypothetical protein